MTGNLLVFHRPQGLELQFVVEKEIFEDARKQHCHPWDRYPDVAEASLVEVRSDSVFYSCQTSGFAPRISFTDIG
ncbi:hypothetical protein ES708_24904 [subsurface metagenome]